VSLTLFINSSNSFEVAFPLLVKKLQCFSEISALPTLKFSQLESLINSQAFLFFVFLKVLPQFFILLVC